MFSTWHTNPFCSIPVSMTNCPEPLLNRQEIYG